MLAGLMHYKRDSEFDVYSNIFIFAPQCIIVPLDPGFIENEVHYQEKIWWALATGFVSSCFGHPV